MMEIRSESKIPAPVITKVYTYNGRLYVEVLIVALV